MALVGLGLIPDESIVTALITFRQRWEGSIGGPMLGTQSNIPHISMYQFPSDDPANLLIPESLGPPTGSFLHWTQLAYQPVGWIFANVAREDWIDNYQALVVQSLLPQLDHRLLQEKEELVGYSDKEKENYLRFGYKYVADEFRPHVTLGRTNDNQTSVPRECIDDFGRQPFTKERIPLSKVVLYRAGPLGELVEVMHTLFIL